MSRDHTNTHKRLDDALNELVKDFFDYGMVNGLQPHTASIHDLLTWSSTQAICPEHPNKGHTLEPQ